jgi:RNA polymerase sigma factor (sigma-70 family)
MLVVGLARSGDRAAFEELVRRRQTWIRNLMRRCCGDAALADDLAQQVFLQAWKNIRRLQQANRFAGWLKRLAVNTWLQHLRKNDPLKNAAEQDDNKLVHRDTTGIALDLDRALATLSDQERLCVVLSYHESLTHGEIAKMTDMPLGTVKSYIRRGTKRLRETLSAYSDGAQAEELE